MKNNEKGTVLIVVAGVLAALFIVGITGIMIASAAAKETASGLDSIRSRFAADSALELCLAAFGHAQATHDSFDEGINEDSASPDEALVKALLEKYRELTHDGSGPMKGFTNPLWIDSRARVFDIGAVSDGTRVLEFAGTTALASTVDAYTYVESPTYPDLTVTFPAVDLLPTDSYQYCGEGKVEFRLLGWGVSLKSLEIPVPIASTYVMAVIEIKFEVGAKKVTDGGTGFLTNVSVCLVEKPKLKMRTISDDFDTFEDVFEGTEWGATPE